MNAKDNTLSPQRRQMTSADHGWSRGSAPKAQLPRSGPDRCSPAPPLWLFPAASRAVRVSGVLLTHRATHPDVRTSTGEAGAVAARAGADSRKVQRALRPFVRHSRRWKRYTPNIRAIAGEFGESPSPPGSYTRRSVSQLDSMEWFAAVTPPRTLDAYSLSVCCWPSWRRAR